MTSSIALTSQFHTGRFFLKYVFDSISIFISVSLSMSLFLSLSLSGLGTARAPSHYSGSSSSGRHHPFLSRVLSSMDAYSIVSQRRGEKDTWLPCLALMRFHCDQWITGPFKTATCNSRILLTWFNYVVRAALATRLILSTSTLTHRVMEVSHAGEQWWAWPHGRCQKGPRL